MKILITGISGFVGPYLKHGLQQSIEGVEIYGIGRSKLKNAGENYFSVDMTSVNQFNSIIQEINPDVVFHLAAESSVAKSWENPMSCIRNNMLSLVNLCNILSKTEKLVTLVSVGSAEVYGKLQEGEEKVSEEREPMPLNPYAISRVAQEQFVKLLDNKESLRIVSARSFNHFGLGQTERFVIPSFAKQVASIKLGLSKNEFKVGNLEVIRDFLDVRDVVQAYIALMQSGMSGELYNVCSGQGVSLHSVIQKLENLASLDLNIQEDLSRMRPVDNPIIIGDNKKLLSLGWQAQYSFDQTLSEIYHYYIKSLK